MSRRKPIAVLISSRPICACPHLPSLRAIVNLDALIPLARGFANAGVEYNRAAVAKLTRYVWSGRASPEVFADLSVMRSCINVSGLSLERVLRATMDISAPAFSLVLHRALPDLQRMKRGSPVFASAGKTVLHLVSSSRRPRQVTIVGAMSSLAPHRCSSFVRAMRPFLRPGLRLFQGTARRGRQGWPSRLAHLWLGISRPRLDGPEHGATLTQIGTPSHLSSHIRICAPC
jgi:hypothetical protein